MARHKDALFIVYKIIKFSSKWIIIVCRNDAQGIIKLRDTYLIIYRSFIIFIFDVI